MKKSTSSALGIPRSIVTIDPRNVERILKGNAILPNDTNHANFNVNRYYPT